MRAPIGIRIRRKRLQLGLSQATLARAAGISPSYLNLIENNKRVIGGKLLMRIAERLSLEMDELSGLSEQRMIQGLEELLADPVMRDIEIERSEVRELVARFPEAGTALTRLYRAYSETSAGIEAYANRLRSDPLLSQMLHQVLNRIAAMRSSAEILDGVPDLAEADRIRFTGMISHEAHDLTEIVRNLASYFDQSASGQKAGSPLREVEEAIITANNHFPALEDAAENLRREVEAHGAFGEAALAEALQRRFGISCRKWPERERMSEPYRFDPEAAVLWFRASTTAATRQFQMSRIYALHAAGDVLERQSVAMEPTSDEARQLMRSALSSYMAGAIVMPYAEFLRDAEERHYDIELLGHLYTASFEQAAHRLVTLRRKGAEGVPFGFLRADRAGRLTKRFPLPGLTLPGSGHGCLLWPIYDAFGASGVVREVCEFTNGGRYLLLAKAVTKRVSAYQEQPLVFSVMLACDILHADRTVYGHGLDLSYEPKLVGPSCRLCTRQDCAHRQETAAMAAT
ncbi:short-chain fatty acyl-CoA regulator family protein [Mesorhizobium sp. KR2-14]|uniref:helix-turn-helix domain-containing protein n=1 Tax=Mesorhizobium sp. KR2-14 TaxID=3156610 RepID=UPI0032B33BD8